VASEETLRLREKTLTAAGEDEAAVFDAHLLILKDPEFLAQTTSRVRSGLSVEQGVAEVAEQFAAQLEALQDDYLAQRAIDIRDVAVRLVRALEGGSALELPSIPQGSIVIADELAPSDTVSMDPDVVAGIATSRGGPASHTVIFARAMQLPAVVGVGPELSQVKNGEVLVLNGQTGELVIRPTEEDVARARRPVGSARKNAGPSSKDEVHTRDGRRIEVGANIGHPREARAALDEGAEGIGLLRSEFLYLGRATVPDEEEQYEAYRSVAKVFGSRPVIIRTLDLGGDKPVSYLPFPAEANPFLGWRGLRICLDERELFLSQLRAILRASAHGRVRLMFPMITGLDEIQVALGLLEEAKRSLRARNQSFDSELEVGIMVETPAAALLAGQLASEVDFFSLGTNDLTQYALAVDRTNERIAWLYRPEHPAVLRLMSITATAAKEAGRWVGICGEMAGDLPLVPLLIGLGLRELSVSVSRLAEVRHAVGRLEAEACRRLAEEALACASPDGVRRLLPGKPS
jgi:phosphotransferase system enzyme I (PtsI)